MPRISIRNLIIALLGLAVCTSLVCAYTAHEARDISESVLRLHIVANSDSAADQNLKLKVRDEVIKSCSPLFKGCKSAQQAQVAAEENIEFITKTADRVIRENGFDYTAECRIGKCSFPTKTYKSASGGVSLPCGEYSAVNIRLGNAEGQNWWCVMYPPLCFVNGVASMSDETDDMLKSELSPSEYELITDGEKQSVKIRFKIAELLGK